MLVFLADCSTRKPAHPLKERDIAVGFFGRSPYFDPQNDSVVRVHAGRLRSKLAEYYINEGSADPIVSEIPRGAYALTHHLREKSHPETEVVAPVMVQDQQPPVEESRRVSFPAEMVAELPL